MEIVRQIAVQARNRTGRSDPEIAVVPTRAGTIHRKRRVAAQTLRQRRHPRRQIAIIDAGVNRPDDFAQLHSFLDRSCLAVHDDSAGLGTQSDDRSRGVRGPQVVK